MFQLVAPAGKNYICFIKTRKQKKEYAAGKRVPFNTTHHPINVQGGYLLAVYRGGYSFQ